VIEKRDDFFTRDVLAELLPALELVQEPSRLLVCAQVGTRRLGRRRRVEPVRALEHRSRQVANRGHGVFGRAQRLEVGQWLATQLLHFLLDPGRCADRPAPEPPLEEVRVLAGQARVGRAQEREQVATLALEPRVAEEGQQRLAERRLAEADPALERVRDAEGREGRVESGAPAVEARADDADLLGRRAGPEQGQHLLCDELECPPQARAFQEADGAIELRSSTRPSKQRALEVRKNRRARGRVRGKLLEVGGE
jgi:hypothetical protein